MPDIQSILQYFWGYDSYRPLQQAIIESVLEKKDTLALLPTGGGKSICYQVPAVAQEGICLVISPLIALMKDQIENLRKRGILALAIYSGMSRRQIIQTLKNAASNNYKLLYISPERIETALFHEYLPSLDVSLIAVDEAHCISQWGYDFRPSYLRIVTLRDELPGVPVLALTASATEEVQQDICEKLLLKTCSVFRQSYVRSNLSYSAFSVDAKLNKLVDIIKKVQGSAIVYCKSRRRTTEIARLLQIHRIAAQHYHAGLPAEERNRHQQAWIEDKVKVMVCTSAFGMGIDKPDVRLVIHADLPDCLESYYQEAGRAGRDGKRSYAVLLYNKQDITELSHLHTKRYPSLDQIKEVYTALVNYLQIPVYTGEDVSYIFRFEEFIRQFKLNGFTALSALKALEQDGWIEFNEKNFTPSTILFTTSRQQLHQFYESHPQFESLLTTLLRTYEGIVDVPVFVSENLLGRLLKVKEEEIKKCLQQVASHGIISYVQQTDEPQIVFRKNRVTADDLSINISLYNKRKKAFTERGAKMIAYTNIVSCRSTFINSYFGDKETMSCKICDNCLRPRSISVSNEEFEHIHTSIKNCLETTPLTATELLVNLKGVQKEKAQRVIDFLQAENKIEFDHKGVIRLR